MHDTRRSAIPKGGNGFATVLSLQGPPAGAAPLCYSLYVQKRPRSWVGLGARFEAHLADARQQGDAQVCGRRALC